MKTRILLLVVSGLALALIVLAVYQSMQAFAQSRDMAAEGAPDLQRTLLTPRFRGAEESVETLDLRGSAEPEAVVSLLNAGARVLQVQADETGTWAARVAMDAVAPMELTLESFVDGEPVRGDEQLLRVPAPGAADGVAQKALLLLTAPGQASQVLQTPFGEPMTDGPLSLESMDYDGLGGLLVAGQSREAGVIRLSLDGVAIGERPAVPDEAWYFIAANALDADGVDVGVSLLREDLEVARLDTRLDPLGNVPLRQDPTVWKVRRQLPGGGEQTTAVFATPPDEPLDEPGDNGREE